MVKAVAAEEKKEILDRVEERAAAHQYEFRGCGRSLVLALQQEFDLPGGTAALKAASFGGLGIARNGNACGALFGGVVAIGLAHGPENLEDPIFPQQDLIDENTGNPKSVEVIKKFFQKFEQEMGGTLCRDIQLRLFGRCYNTLNPAENKEFSQVSREKCAEQVGKIARYAAEAILDMPKR